MKGEITSVEKIFDNATCTYYWCAVTIFEDIPPFKLGKCEVTQ